MDIINPLPVSTWIVNNENSYMQKSKNKNVKKPM